MKTLRYVCLFAALLIHCLAMEQENLQLAAFDQVWNTVHERHWDKAKVGAEWEQARERLRPEAERARTASEVRPVIQRLLNTLGESHFYVIPAEAYEQLRDEGGGAAEPEFDFRILDDEAVVTRASDCVKPGWVLRKVEGQDVAQLIAKVKAGVPNPRQALLVEYSLIHQRLSGAEGKTKVVTFSTVGDQLQTVSVPLKVQGRMVQLGNLPPFSMQIEARRLDDVEYFRFSAFLDPAWLQKELETAVTSCSNCAGFILDLRGNFGGIVAQAAATAAWFEPGQKALGTIVSAAGKMQLMIFPRPRVFSGKLAVLVDSLSLSSAEFLAQGFKDLNRARLFGEVTQGAALPSVIERLPNGDRFQFAIANYVSAAGAAVEGAGVTPHVAVRLNRNDYLAGRDPVLAAACQWIHSKER